MNVKKIFVGGMILSAMFINFSAAFAEPEEIEIFGGDFDEVETDSSQKVSETLNTQPTEVGTPTKTETEVQPQEKISAAENVATQEQKPVEEKVATQENFSDTEIDDVEEDLGDELNFDDLTNRDRNENSDAEVVKKISDPIETEIVEIDETETSPVRERILQPSKINSTVSNSSNKNSTQSKSKLKNLKSRFVKLTMDSNYIYYLDRDFVRWVKMPYSTTEMMADVWVRMIERNDNELLSDSEIDDVIFAAEEGKQYRPEDLEVLRHGKYHLEHYYLRPKARQIQYLVELSDIEGNPQNTVNERTYSYSNWEDLVPNSVESRLYFSILKVIGKGRASQDSPVTFADYVEEYARISIR